MSKREKTLSDAKLAEYLGTFFASLLDHHPLATIRVFRPELAGVIAGAVVIQAQISDEVCGETTCRGVVVTYVEIECAPEGPVKLAERQADALARELGDFAAAVTASRQKVDP